MAAHTFEEKIKAGEVSSDGWPDTAYFVRDGKVEKVEGWLEIQTLLREDDSYPTQMHGTREAAEEFIEMTFNPADYWFRQHREGHITAEEFVGLVGAKPARERGIARG